MSGHWLARSARQKSAKPRCCTTSWPGTGKWSIGIERIPKHCGSNLNEIDVQCWIAVAVGRRRRRMRRRSTPLGAETLVEQVADTRLVLAFRVDPVELQKVVPGPWDIVGTPAGPAKDANFNVIFYDRMLQQDGAGASMGPPYRFIVFTTVVKPKEASAAAMW